MGANALFTAVSGLNANQTYLGVIGNNIANSNTVGFKSSDPIFENLVSQTLSGTSSSQEGLGTDIFSIQQQFAQGAMQNTSNPLNMAVDGNGFFIVQAPNGSTYYTRNGTFSENAKGQIVDSTGVNVVQGYALNAQGIATAGTPSSITLNTAAISPLATTSADLTANLDSNVSPQTTPTTTTGDFMGGYITSNYSVNANTLNVSDMTNVPSNGGPSSLLIGNGDGSSNLYTVSEYCTSLNGGGTKYTPGNIPANTTIESVVLSSSLTSNVDQNTAISQQTLGVTSTTGILPGADMQIEANSSAATTPGAYQFLNTVQSVSSANKTVNLSNAMPIGNSANGSTSTFTAGGSLITGPANDYYSTTINVYDSLGNALPMTVTFAPSSSTSGNWNAYYSINGTAAQRPSLSATADKSPDVVFNTDGQITGTPSLTFNDAPAYVSATTPLSPLPDGSSQPLNIALNLANLTQYAAPSATTAFTQNGYATGTLTSFTVDQNGKISGEYSNGQTKYLYQVALANFIAPTGLVSEGNSLYSQTFASGQPAVGAANSGNFGYITDSALEQSNVNISSEFTNMIVAQNAYVANSKVLTTENAVLNALESSVQ
jgi:flagellar hook protein FlgE